MMEGMAVQAATQSKIIFIRTQKVTENQAGTTREQNGIVAPSESGILSFLVKWRLHHCALACAAFIAADRQSSEAAASDPSDNRGVASAELGSSKAREFWAFQPVRLPPVLKAQSARFKVQNPVDAF